jgi:hypothetical protein
MKAYKRIDGTGENRDNRGIVVGLALLSPSPLFPHLAMALLDIPLGLIINFNELKLTDGVSRLILPGANMD